MAFCTNCKYREVCDRFLKSLSLSEEYFETKQEYNLCYCENCHTESGHVFYRGKPSKKYTLPKGWTRFALKAPSRAKALKAFEQWHIAFHGTSSQSVCKILETGSLICPGAMALGGHVITQPPGHYTKDWKPKDFDLDCVFVSPSINYAGSQVYAKYTCFDDPITRMKYNCQVAFQVLIEPNSYTVGRETLGMGNKVIDADISNLEIEWSTKQYGAIILYGILIKADGMLRPLSATPPDVGPSSNGSAHRPPPVPSASSRPPLSKMSPSRMLPPPSRVQPPPSRSQPPPSRSQPPPPPSRTKAPPPPPTRAQAVIKSNSTSGMAAPPPLPPRVSSGKLSMSTSSITSLTSSPSLPAGRPAPYLHSHPSPPPPSNRDTPAPPACLTKDTSRRPQPPPLPPSSPDHTKAGNRSAPPPPLPSNKTSSSSLRDEFECRFTFSYNLPEPEVWRPGPKTYPSHFVLQIKKGGRRQGGPAPPPPSSGGGASRPPPPRPSRGTGGSHPPPPLPPKS